MRRFLFKSIDLPRTHQMIYFIRGIERHLRNGLRNKAVSAIIALRVRFPQNRALDKLEFRVAVARCRRLFEAGQIEEAESVVQSLRTRRPQSGALDKLELFVAVARCQELIKAGETEEAKKIISTCQAGGLQSKALSKLRDRVAIQKCTELIVSGPHDLAAEAVSTLRARIQPSRALEKLEAHLAVERGLWQEALSIWCQADEAQQKPSAPFPAEWIYQIGFQQARAEIESIESERLRAFGLFSLAFALRPIDEARALLVARGARKHFREQIMELIIRIFSDNTRYTVAVWWAKRLISENDTRRHHMPLLIDALIESSRLDECDDILTTYCNEFGRDTLWLRARIEICYRRGDFVAMHDVMQYAARTKVKRYDKSVRVMDWLYHLVRIHEEPHTLLPPEIKDLAIKLCIRYDKASRARALRILFDPGQSDQIAQEYVDRIRDAVENDLRIPAKMQDRIYNIALWRRDWKLLDSVAELALPDSTDVTFAASIPKLMRHRVDIHLAQADVKSAEDTVCAVLDQLASQHLDSRAVMFAADLVRRLPYSGEVLERLEASARRIGLTELEQSMRVWNARYGGLDPAGLMDPAERRRCFILGNAPSLADLPLHALEGEDVFCVNRGMRAMDLGLPRPKYLVVGDPDVYRNHMREIDADGASVAQCFIGSNCLRLKPPKIDAILFGSSTQKMSLRAIPSAPLHLHRGGTVVVVAAQIAFHMGYREIYIIGVDLDYSGPTTHFYGGGRKETERLGNFRPGGFATDQVNLSFANLQKVVAPAGCRFFNASPGGMLSTLERVRFETLFSSHKP